VTRQRSATLDPIAAPKIVQDYLARVVPAIDAELERRLPAPADDPGRLCEAMRYAALGPGKRLRPALVLAACEAAGGPPDGLDQDGLAAAAAVEMLHAYTLVHDDLPCMDDDTERRGRPTVHVAFGEALAVLAGDALGTLAFEVLAREGGGVAPERRLEALRELSSAAGSLGLVGGQAADLAFPEGGEAEAVEAVAARKTGALFAAACAGGALLGGAPAELVARLRRFGTDAGVAFQIADDLLDGGRAEPCSMVRVLGAEGARARARERLEGALAATLDLGERAEPLRELARYAVERER
jgi:geranylgeranyl pyrophosphate synthase